jgi:hypothetical protein
LTIAASLLSLGAAHRLADRLAGAMGRIPRLYADGFGDLEQLEQLVALVRDSDVRCEPGPIEVRWSGPARRRGPTTVRAGTFESPVPHHLLPPETRVGHVRLLLPPEPAPGRPICLHLASTGEQGFTLRTLFATPLIRRGVAALLLENPFYGLRRPKAQFGCSLRTVRDQFAMNYTTVTEARCLLAWLRREGYTQIGVTGYSQGGMMTAFAAALTSFPLAAVPRGAADSAAPIFLDGGLSKSMNWPKLVDELGEQARSHFARCLEPVTVSHFPPPVDPTLAIIINARHDGFVPPEGAMALHRHWAGSELRWLDGGHVTAALHLDAQRRAICDALARLQSKHP